MKIKNLFSFCTMICGVMALASCVSEGSENTQERMNSDAKQMTFLAEYDNCDISSRTILSEGKYVYWSEGDKISLFDNADRHEFTLSDGKGTKNGSFSGQASYNTKTYYAVYPYSESQVRDGNTIKNVKIPNEQHATPGTFDPEANVMTAVATADNKKLYFKNVCSYAKITTTAPSKKIIVGTERGQSISGTFDLTLDEEEGVVTNAVPSQTEKKDEHGISIPSTDREVTLVPQKGDNLIPAGTYYIALIAGDIPNLRVEFVDENEHDRYRTVTPPVGQKITNFKRGKIIGLGEAPADWISICPDGNHPHIIDLGLSSGLKWACMNVGADQPSGWGDFYAWGEVETKALDNYTKASYKLGTDYNQEKDTYSLIKYCNDSKNGVVDNKLILEPADDAAYQVWSVAKGDTWGTKWRMPTLEEMKELVNNCTWERTRFNNKNGYFVKHKVTVNNKEVEHIIFIPGSGWCFNSVETANDNFNGRYRTSTVYQPDCKKSWGLDFDESSTVINIQAFSRFGGRTIRPVWDDNLEVENDQWKIVTP